MKKTFKELQEIDAVVGRMYKKDPNLINTKFGYNYKRWSEVNYVPHGKEFNTLLEAIRIENALENPTTKEIMIDIANERGYKYSKEGMIKCMNEEIKLAKEWEKKEFEIAPRLSSYTPPNMTEEEIETLLGILISKRPEEVEQKQPDEEKKKPK